MGEPGDESESGSEAAADWIGRAAREIGFTLVGIGPAGPWPHADALEPWLEAGRHGTMRWMARAPEIRADPRRRFPWARSVLMLGLHYRSACACAPAERRPISRYAWGTDYHDVIPRMLKRLAARLRERWPALQLYWFCDTSPVLERAAAVAAGLGWIGRNTMLIHEREGSYVFLAGMLLDLALPADRPAPARCGRCTRCLPACPTDAFIAPYVLDARRCISYLTIEHRGPIPRPLRPKIGTLVFGCDICQAICPWNERALRKEPLHTSGPFLPRPGLSVDSRALLEWLLEASDEAFRTRFRKSPVKRTGRERMARNAAVALGNLGDPAALAALERALARDPSPLVRAHAAWAIGTLLPAAPPPQAHRARAALARASARDPAPEVREEARQAAERSAATD